jgi:hypothetical protein
MLGERFAMKTDSLPSKESLQPDVHPLRRDIHSPGAWRYLLNYLLLGSSTLFLLMEMIESGAWRRLWWPVLGIWLAMGNLAAMQAAERKGAKPR